MGENSIEAASTDFPSHIQIHINNRNFLLDKTGSTVKEGFYTIAHYLQGAVDAPETVILVQIFSDGEVKEFLIDWEKAFTADAIQKELRSSFSKALTNAELEEHKDFIEEFLHFFDQDVKKREQVKILWLAEGDLRVFYGAKQKGKIVSIPFAKAVWKLWLGPKSVVARSLLIDDYIYNDAYRD